MGRATTIAMRLVVKVAITSGQIPNSPMAGCHLICVKNSTIDTSGRAKKRSASSPNTKMIPAVVRMEIAPQANKNH